MYNPAIMTLIKLIGTSSLSVVQYVKHIGANIPLYYFTKGGSEADPPKNFLGVNNPPLLRKIFWGKGGFIKRSGVKLLGIASKDSRSNE